MALEVALYLALTIVITWPLGADLASTLPGDYGDPVFVCWVLSWVMQQLTGMLTGDATAVTGFWHAPIFFPERNTLALSEHFVPQAVQALPVWWATGNIILSYNVLVILTFVLTALGTSLLVQELTGSRLAGALAGIIAAFNPYRLQGEIGHLHALSIQWLPFALLGLHRFVRSGSGAALALSAGSALALNLSSVYYMLYCAPFVALFTLVDMSFHRKLTDRRVWAGLIIAAVCMALVTVPFVVPYLNMQRQHGFERPLQDLILFSATFDRYRAVLPWLGIAIAWAGLAVMAIWHREARAWRGYAVVFLVFTLLTVWLSLGPVVRAGEQPVGIPSLYQVLYDWVPGFSGLRAVSRYAGVMLVFLSVSAGIGAAWVARLAPRAGRAAIAVSGVWFLWQVWPAPFQLNEALPSPGLQLPPAYLTPAPSMPAIYAAVARLDGDAVLVELPFGDPWYDIRYMFFAATHGRRLMNGYSGVFPASYIGRQRRLADPFASPGAARDALTGATHVIVHEHAWVDDTGPRIEGWLESLGAVLVAEQEGARLLALEPLRRDARRPNGAP